MNVSMFFVSFIYESSSLQENPLVYLVLTYGTIFRLNFGG